MVTLVHNYHVPTELLQRSKKIGKIRPICNKSVAGMLPKELYIMPKVFCNYETY